MKKKKVEIAADMKFIDQLENWMTTAPDADIQRMIDPNNLAELYKEFGYAPRAWADGIARLRAELKARQCGRDGLTVKRTGQNVSPQMAHENGGDIDRLRERTDAAIYGATEDECLRNMAELVRAGTFDDKIKEEYLARIRVLKSRNNEEDAERKRREDEQAELVRIQLAREKKRQKPKKELRDNIGPMWDDDARQRYLSKIHELIRLGFRGPTLVGKVLEWARKNTGVNRFRIASESRIDRWARDARKELNRKG